MNFFLIKRSLGSVKNFHDQESEWLLHSMVYWSSHFYFASHFSCSTWLRFEILAQLLCTMIFLKLNLSLHTCTENRSSVTYKVESHRPRQLITVCFYIVSFYGYVRQLISCSSLILAKHWWNFCLRLNTKCFVPLSTLPSPGLNIYKDNHLMSLLENQET